MSLTYEHELFDSTPRSYVDVVKRSNSMQNVSMEECFGIHHVKKPQ